MQKEVNFKELDFEFTELQIIFLNRLFEHFKDKGDFETFMDGILLQYVFMFDNLDRKYNTQ